MPELPEVETIRRDLAAKIAGRKISAVKIIDKKLGKTDDFADFLVNQKIAAVDRIGKLLIFNLSGNKFLLIHLKMTGQLIYEEKSEIIAGGHSMAKNKGQGEALSAASEEIGGSLPNRHTRAIISWGSNRKLFFNDMRRFGYFKIVGAKELEEIKGKYGIEPLQPNFTLENFKKIMAGKKIAVRKILLDQQAVSGIGNIYVSEILFAARVNPFKIAGKLKQEEIERIFKASKEIMKKAIKYRGTTFSDYRDAGGKKGNFSRFLKVYERAGKDCPGCAGTIKTIKYGGRSAYFCPKCQKNSI